MDGGRLDKLFGLRMLERLQRVARREDINSVAADLALIEIPVGLAHLAQKVVRVRLDNGHREARPYGPIDDWVAVENLSGLDGRE